MIHVGTAGWGIPRTCQESFPGAGSHLERYARVLGCCEINSTFKHRHRAATLLRWAEATSAGFRFAVKLPHRITHALKLAHAEEALAEFIDELAPLGARLGPLLVQLPPSLAFDDAVATAFFAALRQCFAGAVVCEPRHASWFGDAADALLRRFTVCRAAADPARLAQAALPGGVSADAAPTSISYFRWHGSPDMYRSGYTAERLLEFSVAVRRAATRGDCWCIFDNTAAGQAAANAVDFLRLVTTRGGIVVGRSERRDGDQP